MSRKAGPWKSRLGVKLCVESLEDRLAMAVSNQGELVVDPPLPPFHSTVPAARLDLLDRGINLSGWFRYPDEETAEWFTNHVTDADLQQIRDLGFEHVRLPLWPSLFFLPEQSSAPDPTLLGYLDTALDRILAHDLAVVVDIHDEDQLLEGGPEVVDDFVDFWSSLAGHLSSYDPDRVFLEVINEPVFYDADQDWHAIQERLLTAMRAAAPEHTLIAAGPGWSHIDGLLGVTPVADTNVIYTFHFYDDFLFTHQGAPWTDPSYEHLRGLPYPSTPQNVAGLAARLQATLRDPADAWIPAAIREYGQERWNAAKLEARIRRAVDWAATQGVTLYVGEFGVHRDGGVGEADRDRWHHDVSTLLTKYDIGWSMWDYDENFGLIKQAPQGRLLDVSLAKALGLTIPSLPPVNQLPAGLSVKEDTRLVFTPKARELRIVNPNANAFAVEVTLSVSHGVFTLATRNGLSFAQGDGTADRALRFQGSPKAVAAALANANFLPDRDYFGTASIEFESRLVGASAIGSNGGPAIDSDLLTIQVLPVNDAPVLTVARIALPPELFGITPHAGIAVGALLAGHVTDADPGALRGIALTGIGTTQRGGWEFSLDGGATWRKVNAASATSALLLRDTDRLRFVGTAAGPLKYVAWDQTSGEAGQRVPVLGPRSGGSTAFSTTRAIASNVTVTVG